MGLEFWIWCQKHSFATFLTGGPSKSSTLLNLNFIICKMRIIKKKLKDLLTRLDNISI